MKNFVRDGKTITRTNTTGTTIASSAIVIAGSMLAVSFGEILDDATGELSIDGVFELPKEEADVITQGEKLTFDVAGGVLRNAAYAAQAGDLVGSVVAMSAASGTESTVQVKIGFPGIIAA